MPRRQPRNLGDDRDTKKKGFVIWNMAYLDYNSTTPVDSRVVEIMVPIFNERFGNPSSVGHETGRVAGGPVEDARSLVGQAVGMRAPDVIFTSGATEANNLAFAGLRRGLGRPIRMLVGATEHKSALQTCRALEEDGSTLNMIPVRSDGPIDLDALDGTMTDDTDVVSVMAANSETGVPPLICLHQVPDLAHLGLLAVQSPRIIGLQDSSWTYSSLPTEKRHCFARIYDRHYRNNKLKMI